VDAHTFTKQAEKSLTNYLCQTLKETDFWDKKGVLMVEFVQQGTIIKSEVYSETPKDLRRTKALNAGIRGSAPP
jgi:hypothetical protein